MFVIDGLGHTCKKFVITLHVRQINSFHELYDLAIQEEYLLKRMSSLTFSTGMALVANHTPNNTNHTFEGSPNFNQRGHVKGQY